MRIDQIYSGIMKKSAESIILLGCLIFFFVLNLQGQITYHLQVNDPASGRIQVSIDFAHGVSLPISFIMPKYIPGRYEVAYYDRYIESIEATDHKGNILQLQKDVRGAPRWEITGEGEQLRRLHYTVDVRRMELAEHFASDASIMRNTYAGLLNYSIFGWLEGQKNESVQLNVMAPADWPIFCTITPQEKPEPGEASFTFPNFGALADAQIQMGSDLQIAKFAGPVPFYVTNYSETAPADLAAYGKLGIRSLEILKDYFGELPFEEYTLVTHALAPIDEAHQYNFSMEHLKSTTHFTDTSGIIVQNTDQRLKERRIFTILHHIAHAFIPLRCHGASYSPEVEELPKIIENIWFNEGFIWFICYDKLQNPRLLNRIRAGAKQGNPIDNLSLIEVSRIGSFYYGLDFRFGIALFSRGALMAYEMNEHILEKTAGKHSMQTALRYLYNWVKTNQRPFREDEFTTLLKMATGVDVQGIYEQWIKSNK